MANNEIIMEVQGSEPAQVEVQVEVGDNVFAKNAEAWAVGERGGVPVSSGDPTYHNNSKYYAGVAEDAAEAAAAAVVHEPRINTTTNKWEVWDQSLGQYVTTNIDATGPRGATGAAGATGPKGDPFTVKKTFPSIADMEAYTGTDVHEGDFVVISSDVEDPDNGKLYVKNSTGYSFITDLSGAQGMRGDPGPAGATGSAGQRGDTGATGPVGATGADGVSAYVHIKYSATEPTQDSDMKDTPDEWMGVYSGTSQTAPTSYTNYVWSKVKSDIEFVEQDFQISTSDWTGSSAPYTYSLSVQGMAATSTMWVFYNSDYYEYATSGITATPTSGAVTFSVASIPAGTITGTVRFINNNITAWQGGSY